MAIEPFRQKIGVPGGAGVTDARVGQLDSLGPAISQIGGQILEIAEPYAKAEALKQGAADFAATGLGKDHDGNYYKPQPIEGGIVYAAAFNKAASDQYFLQVHNDTERRITQVYTDPENIGKLPKEKEVEAQAIVDGVLAGAAPEQRAQLYESLNREIRQRDLAENNFHYRKQYELIVNTNTKQLETEYDQASEAWSWGDTPENQAQGLVHQANAAERAQTLVRLGVMGQWEADQIPFKMQSYKAAGVLRGEVREAWKLGNLSYEDNEMLQRMVLGTAPEGTVLLGHTQEEIRDNISDERARTKLAADIGQGSALLHRQEEEQRKQDELTHALDSVPVGGGFPLDATEKDKQDITLQFTQGLGLDPFSRDGVVQVFARFGELPKAMYEKVFANSYAKTPQQIEQTYQLYDAMQNMPNTGGLPINVAESNMKPEDSAFMYHYANARRMGSVASDARDHATAATEKKLDIKPGEVTTFLRQNTGLEVKNGIDKLGDEIDEHLGVNWKDLNAPARDTVSLDAAQQIAMGVPWQTAFKSAGDRFKANWTIDETSLENVEAKTRGGVGYTPKANAMPKVTDVKSRQLSDNWAYPAMHVGIQHYAATDQPVPGVPDKKDLKPGINVWAKATGQETPGGGKLFQLFYFDPAKGTGIVRLTDTKGSPLTLDLGREAQRQQTYANLYVKAHDAAQTQIAELRKKIRGTSDLEQFAMNVGGGVPGVPMSPSLVDDPKAIAQLRQAEKDFAERFPKGGPPLQLGKDFMYGATAQKGAPEKKSPLYMPPYAEFSEDAMKPPEGYTARLEATRANAEGRTARYQATSSGGKSHGSEEMRALALQRGLTDDKTPQDLVKITARLLGLTPIALGGILDRESGFNPKADNGTHQGLFQASKDVRTQFKIDKNSTWAAQLNALVSYALDPNRKYRPGMGWQKLYTTINAGNANAPVTAADANGSQTDHYRYIETSGFRNSRRFLGQG